MCKDLPKPWNKWLPLAEYWYNISFQSTIGMSLFKALFGYNLTPHNLYIARDSLIDVMDKEMKTRKQIITLLKQSLIKA